ncbi:MAG: ATP-binding cassette domain-containing protein [Candidatus Cloacimonadota bacterium]|nr:ATP-binding cassette domain-containing protein [Candidatus Cloacimonadota bacterium]
MQRLNKENMDNIFQAIVSIYINLLNIGSIVKKDSNLVYDILNSIFKRKIGVQNIQKIVSSIYSNREAVNILKKHLNKSDKIKLIINLLTFLYHYEENFQIVGSLEIVKLIDLLYIDLNLYDQLLDVMTAKSSYVDMNLDDFANDRDDCILKNDLLIGNITVCDVFFKSSSLEDIQMYFLLFEGINFVATFEEGSHQLNREIMIPNRFYVFKEKDVIEINDNNSIKLNYQQIMQLKSYQKDKIKQSAYYQKDKVSFDLIQNNVKLSLKIKAGKVNVCNKLVRGIYDLAINDFILLEDEKIAIIDLLLRNRFITPSQVEEKVHYLEYVDDFIQINLSKNDKTIAKLEKEETQFTIEPINSKQVFLNNKLLKQREKFYIGKDVFTFENNSCKINKFFNILKIDYDISEISVTDLYYHFDDDGSIGLNGINFTAVRGEMMSIMGPSGSGKTTLLRALLGELNIYEANIKIDGQDFFSSFHFFQKYISYVPQQDLLFANLTVYQNLFYSARLRLTHIKDKNKIIIRIEQILKQIGLWEKRNMYVGDQFNKTISGGQRKRLNVALELLSDPLIIFMDEPTSGLSSKDSEKMIDMMHELKQQGKIIIATIHQPNPDLFQQFDKFLFLDKLGTQVYFGDSDEVFQYFNIEYNQLVMEDPKLKTKKDLKMPEYLFDILEFPKKEEHSNSLGVSDELFEESYGNRRFSPTYWKEKYKRLKLFELLKDIKKDDNIHENEFGNNKFEIIKLKFHENFQQFTYLLFRNVINKFNNKTNLLVTFIAPIVLSLILAFILRYRVGSEYVYYNNKNAPMFSFISIIIFIFLGLANSLDDILTEKLIFLRERKINVKTIFFLLSKSITLGAMTLIQVILYIAISYLFLGNKGHWGVNTLFLQLSGIIGFVIGLFFSSFISDRKTIIGILPLVLIPQIIFAGGVIKFDDMNPDLKLFFKNKDVPAIFETIASKWLFEGMVVAQTKWNSFNLKMSEFRTQKKKASAITKSKINREQNKFIKKYDNKNFNNYYTKFLVLTQTGKYTNRNQNFFYSSKKKYFGREFDTIYFDITVVLSMIFLLQFVTFIKLKFYYK